MTGLQNIGPRQAGLRRISGIVGLVAGVLSTVVLVQQGYPRASRLATFVPFLFAGLGFFQAKARVCVAHARQGTCDMDGGAARIDDPDRVAALRRAARSIHASAALFAAVLTAAAYFWPA